MWFHIFKSLFRNTGSPKNTSLILLDISNTCVRLSLKDTALLRYFMLVSILSRSPCSKNKYMVTQKAQDTVLDIE